MHFMNKYDVERIAHEYADHEVLGPAVWTLATLMQWTDSHSDGWAYWPKPVHAANRLITLIEDHERWDRGEYQHPRPGAEATLVALRKALVPIKSFRTKQGADFPVFVTRGDINAEVQRRVEAREAAERAELARLQEKYPVDARSTS